METAGGMAGKTPFDKEGNHSGHPPHWLRGNRGAGRYGAEEAEARVNGQGEEDPGERWFCKVH